MNFFVNILWIFSYPNYNSEICFITQHYVFENFHAPFRFFLHQSLISYTVTANILNFNATVRSMDNDDFIKSPLSCDCASSPFRYAPHGHVITGDLGIIPNENLKRLLLKGPNYREQTSINWRYSIKLIFTVIEDYAKKWAKKESQEYKCLYDWVQHVKPREPVL